ncbi:MAG: hypothetical protein ACLFQX_02910 [Candidatus Kapaibacterium sp.]
MRKLWFLLFLVLLYSCDTGDDAKKVVEVDLENLHGGYEMLWEIQYVYDADRSENIVKEYQLDDRILFSRDGKGIYIHGEVPPPEGHYEAQGDEFAWEPAGAGIKIMGLHRGTQLLNNGTLIFNALTENEVSYSIKVDEIDDKAMQRHIELTPTIAKMNNPSDSMINLTNGLVKTWKLEERIVNGQPTVAENWLRDNTLVMLHDGRAFYVKGEEYRIHDDTTTNDKFMWTFNTTMDALIINQAEHRDIRGVERWDILKLTPSEFDTKMHDNETGDEIVIKRTPYTE